MLAEPQIEFNAEDLVQIVKTVFDSMLAMETEPAMLTWSPAAGRLTALVHMSGSWTGAVMLEVSRGQAANFAHRFLSIGPDQPVDDVVRAVLGELANMIGGNLKCVITPGIQLSMPSVVDGNDYSVLVLGAEVRERLAFDSPEGVFWVTVVSAPRR